MKKEEGLKVMYKGKEKKIEAKFGSEMFKSTKLILLALFLFTLQPGMVLGLGYDPAVTYPGIYEKDRIYRKASGSGNWVGNPRPAFLKEVACSQAKKSLSQEGLWTGLLSKEGSCMMTSEPSEWALGNLLNYQSGMADSGYSKVLDEGLL